jgi:flagellar L-ring protein precursor FlgH
MLVSDFRARNIGDVLTILIEENLKGSKDVKTKTDRKSEYTLGLTGILGLEFEKRLQPRYDNGTVSASKALGGNVNDKFDGSGATSSGTMLSGTVSARVVQVLPGGNLLIEGSRELNVNNETQYIVLTGIVRPKDISRENTISSTKIADARVSYTGAGQLSEKQHQGWLQRLLGLAAPF